MRFEYLNNDISVYNYLNESNSGQAQEHQIQQQHKTLSNDNVYLKNLDLPYTCVTIEQSQSIMLIKCKMQNIILNDMRFDFVEWENKWGEVEGICIRDCCLQTLDCTDSTWKKFSDFSIQGSIIDKLILPKEIEELSLEWSQKLKYRQNNMNELVFHNNNSIKYLALDILPQYIYFIQETLSSLSLANNILDDNLVLDFSQFVNLTIIELQSLKLNGIILNQGLESLEISSFQDKLDYIDFSACDKLYKASIENCDIRSVLVDVDIIEFQNCQLIIINTNSKIGSLSMYNHNCRYIHHYSLEQNCKTLIKTADQKRVNSITVSFILFVKINEIYDKINSIIHE